MPFVFLIVGLLLLVVAVQGTHKQAFSLIKSEFSGANSFLIFAAAFIILGALAYIRPIRPIALGLIGLVLITLILANRGGFFTQFNNAIRNPIAPDVPAPAAVDPTKGSGAGTVAPGSSLPGYEGVPKTPFFYGPVNPSSPYA